MIATPHSLIGALVASRRRSPGAAFALGALSHLAADRVPHSDYNPLGASGKLCGVSDLALAGLLLASVEASAVQWAGALGGIAPDLLSLASRTRDPFSRLVHQPVHSRRRPGRAVGIGVQAAIAICCYAALGARDSSFAPGAGSGGPVGEDLRQRVRRLADHAGIGLPVIRQRRHGLAQRPAPAA
jgi:hypothetical protein